MRLLNTHYNKSQSDGSIWVNFLGVVGYHSHAQTLMRLRPSLSSFDGNPIVKCDSFTTNAYHNSGIISLEILSVPRFGSQAQLNPYGEGYY